MCVATMVYATSTCLSKYQLRDQSPLTQQDGAMSAGCLAARDELHFSWEQGVRTNRVQGSVPLQREGNGQQDYFNDQQYTHIKLPPTSSYTLVPGEVEESSRTTPRTLPEAKTQVPTSIRTRDRKPSFQTQHHI